MKYISSLFNDYLVKDLDYLNKSIFLFKKFYNLNLFERYYYKKFEYRITKKIILNNEMNFKLYLIKLNLFFIESIIEPRKILD